ncbi:MAG: carbohydrate ABC transporter permease [Oscillospiraceae bacterium]|nr:carbohydrate ABC transporter permease [Oscillospiraceae bacterium]
MKRKDLIKIARLTTVSIAAAISLLPVFFIVFNSFMSVFEAEMRYTAIINPYTMLGVTDEFMHYKDMSFLPQVITLSGYRTVLLEDPTYYRYIWNSIILAVPMVLGQLAVAPIAAYGFERLRNRHKDKLFILYIFTMLLPMQALLVPHFITARALGIDGSYLAIILPAVFSPFGVFLIRQQMKGFNKNLIEAASLDGANSFRVFSSIVFPNIKPAITALIVLAFAEAWNVVDQAVVFIRNDYEMPMSVFLSEVAAGDVGAIFAASTVFMFPAILVFIYGQDNMADGLGYTGLR